MSNEVEILAVYGKLVSFTFTDKELLSFRKLLKNGGKQEISINTFVVNVNNKTLEYTTNSKKYYGLDYDYACEYC